MKHLMMLALALFAVSGHARHNDSPVGPAWVCNISGEMDGFSASLGLNVTYIKGVGVVSCRSIDGARKEVPVRLKIVGVGVGLGFTDFDNIRVGTANIGVADGPNALVGTYSVGPSAGVTLINAGLDVGAAIEVSREGGLSFEVGFMGKDARGLEAKLNIQGFEVSPLD